MNKAAKQVEYGLDDTFCDAEELKHSWENTPMPNDEWLTVCSALYDIPKSVMAKEGDRWAVKNRHSQLNCHFQMHITIILYTPRSRRKTPLHAIRTIYVWEDMQQGDNYNAKQGRDLY